MQLSGPTLRQALALATCALVHGTVHAEEGGWKIDGAILHYAEKDRVTAVEPALFATHDLGDEESLTVRAVYDALSGASPNGASPSNVAQTFTGASGQSSYTTPANTLPLKNFSDSRVAFGLDWTARTSPGSGRTLSGNISKESDYLSLGGSSTWTRDFNSKLTTLAWAVGLAYDTIQPEGPVPTGLQSIRAAATAGAPAAAPAEADGIAPTITGASGATGSDGGDEGGGDDGEHNTTLDLMVGITQVLSRRTLVQLNYTVSQQNGYLTDPYKIVSIVDPVTGATVDYVHEKRPSSRFANTLYVKWVHHFERDVVHLSYRYFTDDWGIDAHTTELQYRYRISESLWLEPQFRYHVQSAADFFHHSLAGNRSVSFASADLRLAALTATQVGLKFGARVGSGELSLRFAKMTETGESHPSDAIGIQRQLDLYPKLDATITTVGFSTPL